LLEIASADVGLFGQFLLGKVECGAKSADIPAKLLVGFQRHPTDDGDIDLF
jgi:hypothetical protein